MRSLGLLVMLLVVSCSNEEVAGMPSREIPVVDLGVFASAGGPVGPVSLSPAVTQRRELVDPSYYSALLDRRATCDLMPWLQPVRVLAANATQLNGIQFPAGTGAGEQKAGGVRLPFTMIAEDLAVAGVDIDAVGATHTTASFNLDEYDGQRPQPKPDPVVDVLFAGSVTSGWSRYRGGLVLRQNVLHTLDVVNRVAVPVNRTKVLNATYRGYRCFPKGTQVRQWTWEEWIEAGYTFARHPLQVIVPGLPASPSVADVSADLTFPDDWLVTAVFVNLSAAGAAGGTTGNTLLKITPPQATAIQEDWVSVSTVGTNSFRETAWRFVIPFFVPKSTLWRVAMRKNLDDTAVAGPAVEVVFEGYRLIPPTKR